MPTHYQRHLARLADMRTGGGNAAASPASMGGITRDVTAEAKPAKASQPKAKTSRPRAKRAAPRKPKATDG